MKSNLQSKFTLYKLHLIEYSISLITQCSNTQNLSLSSSFARIMGDQIVIYGAQEFVIIYKFIYVHLLKMFGL
jgi:hypothetical protein